MNNQKIIKNKTTNKEKQNKIESIKEEIQRNTTKLNKIEI